MAVSAFSFAGAVFETILRSSITSDERMKIVAEFEKSKSDDEIAGTMREIYRCGRGFNTDSGKVAVWFNDDGIRIHGGTKARFMPDSQVFSWSDAVKTVGEMLENGTFATNVELAEAQNAEIQRAAQSIWYMNSDISEEARGNVIYVDPNEKIIVAVSSYFRPAVHDRIDFIENILLPVIQKQ